MKDLLYARTRIAPVAPVTLGRFMVPCDGSNVGVPVDMGEIADGTSVLSLSARACVGGMGRAVSRLRARRAQPDASGVGDTPAANGSLDTKVRESKFLSPVWSFLPYGKER